MADSYFEKEATRRSLLTLFVVLHHLSSVLAPGAENTPIHTYAPKEGTLGVIEWHFSDGSICRSGPVYPYIRAFADGYIAQARRVGAELLTVRVPIKVAEILSSRLPPT